MDVLKGLAVLTIYVLLIVIALAGVLFIVWAIVLVFTGKATSGERPKSAPQQPSAPNPPSTSSQPHSAAALEELRKADGRCQHCQSVPTSGAPLSIEELPFPEYLPLPEYIGGGRYTNFRILCRTCKENGWISPWFQPGRFSTDPNTPKTSSPRKPLPKYKRDQVFRRDGYTCRKCGAKGGLHGTLGVQLHIDHIVPVAKGGTDEINNLQVLCAPCNTKKGSKSWSIARLLDAVRDRD